MLSHLCLADVLSCRVVEARVLYVRRIPISVYSVHNPDSSAMINIRAGRERREERDEREERESREQRDQLIRI